MSEDDAGHVESGAGPVPVRFTCRCGATVAADREWRGNEVDLATECTDCGRRHVVTITEIHGALESSPISRDR